MSFRLTQYFNRVFVAVLLNTWNLKINPFVPSMYILWSVFNICLELPNMESLCYGGKSIKILILLYQGQYLSTGDKLF
jgi:hypothetical protein